MAHYAKTSKILHGMSVTLQATVIPGLEPCAAEEVAEHFGSVACE